MQSRRAIARFTSWMAIVAVLMMALAPAISQAVGGDAARAWLEICSSTGPRLVSPESPGTPAQDSSVAHLFEHCPYCSLHTPALGLPPSDLTLRLPAGALHEAPIAFFSAARTLHAWVTAQPRAPPVRT